jgi:flagellar biosynthesis protein FlhG
MKTGPPLVVSVTSGKGGVGKTNLAVNLACCLAREGKGVILLDADLGLANVDILLGLTPGKNLFHLFHEGARLSDVIVETPYGFRILPAASGVSEMLSLSAGQKLTLLEAVDELETGLDYLIVDTGAGINDNVLYFNLAVQERIVILTPEPTSLTDAYALIKVMQQNHGVHEFRILVNLAPDMKAAREVFSRLYKACDHFLAGVALDFAGMIPRDAQVRSSVIAQKPFCVQDPGGPACRAVTELAKTIQTWDVPDTLDGNIKFFWKRLLFRA